MTKIKIVHITSSLKMGGAEAVLCELIKNLDNTLFEHHVIYFHDGYYSNYLKELGIPLYKIQGYLCLYDPIFFKRLYRAVASIQPTIIHSLLWSANNAGRIVGSLLKIPVISVMHNNVDQDGFFRNIVDSMTINLSHSVVAVSEQVADSLKKRYKLLPYKPLTVVANGINCKELQTKADQANVHRSHLGLTSSHFVIGSVGRFMPVKRYDMLLEVFALIHKKHHHARLVLLGLGPLEHQLRAQAERLNIDKYVIFIIGAVSAAYYPLFDCFVQTSDKEGISIALLEAMSFGLPCIVTNTQTYHPVIEHHYNGLVVPAGDSIGCMHALEVLIADPDKRDKLGKSAKKTVEHHFKSEHMTRRYHDIFMNALNSTK